MEKCASIRRPLCGSFKIIGRLKECEKIVELNGSGKEGFFENISK